MTTKRRYTRRSKIDTVIAATMTNIEAASEATGIPSRTIGYWLDQPEYAEIRRKTREDMADESKALAHMVLAKIRERLGEYEPRDMTVLFGVLVDKAQLLSGQATVRSETRDITETLSDHEREALRAVLDEVLAEQVAG